MFQVFASTCDTLHEPIIADIDFELDIDGRTARAHIDGVVEMRGAPILNPVTGAEHRVRIVQPNGFEFAEAEIGRGWSKTQGPGQLRARRQLWAIRPYSSLPERLVALKSMSGTAVERVFRHEGMVVAAALCLLTLLAWLVPPGRRRHRHGPRRHERLADAASAAAGAWLRLDALYWLVAFFMWVVMMVAMMLPSASPMVLLYARVVRQAESQGRASRAAASIAAFASAYFSLWILFSLLAVTAQWALERLRRPVGDDELARNRRSRERC